ncbi:substrate-binding domain-containing protein [Rhodoferax sp.]|uniref:substrate-binding domain-containing protein n=1 Tax=Rhodoferax sp. TaxID=50421 RepID=UPI00260ECE64|nr:substrate-binding domain-containing protein [Rhodoferax sp.]MDD4942843.1 substrate-binding domain-containing protein [Rhodoferax sp.]MDD5478701.1 substrate-binding domain-containing protein [Rhodoferax sp.]
MNFPLLSRLFITLGLLLATPLLTWAQASPPELLLHCGITMVRPMTEIAKQFEAQENVVIRIVQGGSEDLYQGAKLSGQGDWYLPGEPSYHAKHLKEGLFGNFVTVGYNQMALIVQKGNPKKLKADPRELLRKDLTVILGNAESGSVGQEAKTVLDGLGIYPKVVKSAAFLSPDSRGLMNAMKKGDADATLSWRATGLFADNAVKLDVIDLSAQFAKPQALLLIQLKSSQHPELATKFMQWAAGAQGQAIFVKHGFLDNTTPVTR